MTTDNIGFKIITNHFPIDGIPSKEGNVYNNFNETENDYVCRSYDDDGNLYYTAQCNSEDAAEIFARWSERDSGSVYTEIKKKNSDKAWQPFIG